MNKVKLYRNPNRQQTENHKPYIPQYQILGVEPQEFNNASTVNNVSPHKPVVLNFNNTEQDSNLNPRTRKIGVRQPYAEVSEVSVESNNSYVPNVGNNMEHAWINSGLLVEDDVFEEYNPNSPMIDNNEFYTSKALGVEENIPNPKLDTKQDNIKPNIFTNIKNNEYILFLDNQIIFSGPQIEVVKEIELLVFGEHPKYMSEIVSLDRIIVLKKINLRVGVTLE